MGRLLAVFVSLAFGTGTPAAPVPKDPPKGRAYFPTAPKTKWVYDQGGHDLTLMVTEVEETRAGTVVSVAFLAGDEWLPYEKVQVSDAGLTQLENVNGELDPPLVWLKVPFKAGDSWNFKWMDEKGTDTVRGVEKVKVPAGTFDAVRVDSEYTFAGKKMKHSSWYAPGVGRVKEISGSDKEEMIEIVLKSFTPGKE